MIRMSDNSRFVDCGLPWVGAVLDGLLAVLPPLVAVVQDLDLRPRPERDPLCPRPLRHRIRRAPEMPNRRRARPVQNPD